MPLSDHVNLVIQKDTVGIARAGFGIPLILSANASFSERVRYYSDLPGVAADFPVASSPEYLAAQAMLSQTPKPKKIAIGRSAAKPTQVYVIGVSSVQNTHAYQVRVAGQGVTTTTVTSTSDSSATNDEVATDLATQLNLVVGKNFTAAATGSGGSKVCTVTGDAAGNWFSLEVVSVTDLSIKQTHGDPGIAADLTAILLESEGWYALCTLYNSQAYVLAAAAWVEANHKVYVVAVNETEAITTAATSGADTLEELQDALYSRTMGAYYPSPVKFYAAAWLGAGLPLEPGSETWNDMTLVGPDVVALTTTQRQNLTDRNANSYQSVAGLSKTFSGKCADGEFFDTIRGLDWFEDDAGKAIYGVIGNGKKKTEFEDSGAARVEGALRGSIKRAQARKIAAVGTETIEVPLVADVPDSDRAARVLSGVKFGFRLSGAIQAVNVTGTVTA